MTNTLGALTTTIVVSGPAPSSSSSARVLAVSSEYYISQSINTLVLAAVCVSEEETYPKLTFIPILCKSLHTQ
jgi:hypothetical protein